MITEKTRTRKTIKTTPTAENIFADIDAEIEAQRSQEVSVILASTGLDAEAVAGRGDEIPVMISGPAPITSNGNGAYTDPGANWLDELGESYRMAKTAADAAAPEFVDFPSSLVRQAVKEVNKLTRRDVESVLAEFSMNVSLGQFEADARALVVTDINDKEGMKKARELRLVGKRERVRFDAQGAEVKEPLLRRTQLIDGIRRHVRTKFEFLEQHLREQEEFEKREKERIAQEFETSRLNDLARFEWVPTVAVGSLGLGYMTDDQWLEFRSGVERTYLDKKEAERLAAELKREQDERLERENAHLRKKNERVADLTRLGLNYDGVHFTRGEITIALSDIEFASDDAFARLITRVSPRLEEIKTAESDAEKTRLAAEAAVAEERRKREDAEAELSRQAAEKKALDDLLAAAEAKKLLAPDKDNLDTYFRDINIVTAKQPAMKTPEGKELLNGFFVEVAELVNSYAAKAQNLGECPF